MLMLRHQRAPQANNSKRAQSLKKLNLQRLRQMPPMPLKGVASPRSDITLKSMIDEILKYLIEIIETLLEEENSTNYINFMKKNEEMNNQLLKKMNNLVEDKFNQLRAEVMSKIARLPTTQGTKAKGDSNKALKNQRKNIAQSIINFHRSSSVNFNLPQQKSEEFLRLRSEKDLTEVNEEQEKQQMINSLEINSFSAKISDLEQQQSKNLRDLCARLESKIEDNYKDIRQLTEKNVEFRLKFEEKLEANFESLWNVIGNVQGQIDEISNQLSRKR